MLYSIFLILRYYRDIQDSKKGVHLKSLLITTWFLFLIDILWIVMDEVI